MTESEALGFIQGKLDCMKKCGIFNKEDNISDNDCDNCEYCYSQGNFGNQKEAFQIAINALEKQIARNTAEYEYVELDDEIKCPKISRLEAKAIKVALYHQWLKITDDNGNAISCSQKMADATYKMLCLFDNLIKDSDKDNEKVE